MQLKDGGLYETKRGQRFRVTKRADGTFTCRSFGGHWRADGRTSDRSWYADDYRKPHLVVEVEENRWVPMHYSESSRSVGLGMARYVSGHRQKLVTRAEAQKIGEEGHTLHKARQAALQGPSFLQSDQVRTLDPAGYMVGFTWTISKSGNKAVLDIETTSGVKLSLPL